MKTLSSLLLILGMLLLFSCTQEHDIPSPSDSFTLKYQHTANLYDGTLSLQFVELVQDSRCPQGVECIWAGNVTVRLAAGPDSESLNDTLTMDLGPDTDGNERNPIAYQEYTLNLIDVGPYPKWNKGTVTKDYELVLRVEK